jgi:hypothetical protein
MSGAGIHGQNFRFVEAVPDHAAEFGGEEIGEQRIEEQQLGFGGLMEFFESFSTAGGFSERPA